jgi:hypothetical protein
MEEQLNGWQMQTKRFRGDAEQIEAHAKVQYKKNLERLSAAKSGCVGKFQQADPRDAKQRKAMYCLNSSGSLQNGVAHDLAGASLPQLAKSRLLRRLRSPGLNYPNSCAHNS